MSKSHCFRAYIVLLALSLYVSCKGSDTISLKVEIQVPPGYYDSLTYHLSNESFTAYSLTRFESEYFDSTGHVCFDVETNRIGWFFIALHPNIYDNEVKNKSRVFMLVRPGESYRIEYDSSYPLLFRIRGDFEDAQNLYNKLNHSDINSYPRMNWNTNTDRLSTDLLAHLDDSIHNSIIPFADLYIEEKIDTEYFNTIQAQIEYSHADAFLDHLELRQKVYNQPKYIKFFKEVTPLNLSLVDRIYIEEKLFSKFPPGKEEARIVPDYKEYLEKYLKYQARLDYTYSYEDGYYSRILANVKKSSKFFNDELVEYYFAKQFGSAPLEQGPDSLATFLFPAYKERYPESRFMPGIILSVEGLTRYYTAFYPGLNDSHKSAEEMKVVGKVMFSPEINFVQVQDSISTFDSLISQFKGKNLFVDFWASWCPPCRYEFRFADSLHHFLQAHNIEMLYISSDEDETKWHNAILNYNLSGYHFRVSNPELRRELWRMVDFIPTYMIIDSTGRIVVSDAEKPHTKSKLYKQLIESLNLRQRE